MGFLAVVLMIVAVGIMITIGTVINGFVLSVLWGWFMVPIFNLPGLSILPAIGLGLVVTWLTSSIDTREKDTKELKTFWTLIFVRPILVLLTGYIIHSMMR